MNPNDGIDVSLREYGEFEIAIAYIKKTKNGQAILRQSIKGDHQVRLLNIAYSYKVPLIVLCERLKPSVNQLVRHNQCVFTHGKSTVNQIFTERQILEKHREKRFDPLHLFADFKAAFDKKKRSCLYAGISEFFIAAKIIWLCKLK